MVLRCAIHLENESPVYTAGDTLSGFIVLSTTWSDKLYGITVKLASKVEVDWDVSRLFNPYRSSRNEDISFHSHCQIIMNRDGEQSCLSNLVSKRTIMITRGVTHRYPFVLKLPKDLPSTFSGVYGYISYKLVVFIRKPFREMYIGATKAIKLSPILDLNEQSCHFQLPVEEERKFRFGENSGEISMKIRVEKTAFVPEQPIHFTVNVENTSNLPFPGVKVFFNGNTYFQINQRWELDPKRLIRFEGPLISPLSEETWSHSFNCPQVLPTGLGSGLCHLIDLQYFIHFELQVSECVQLVSVFKLVIGTVPYVQRGGHPFNHLIPSDALLPPPSGWELRRSSAPPAYHLLHLQPQLQKISYHRNETPPPSYEEALSMSFSRIRLGHPHSSSTRRSRRSRDSSRRTTTNDHS